MGKLKQAKNGRTEGVFSLAQTTAVEPDEKYLLTSQSGADIPVAPIRIVDLKTKLLSRCSAKKIKTF